MTERQDLAGNLTFNQPLARYTSWRVGGPADLLYRPLAIDDLLLFLAERPPTESIIWLGLGSNTLIRDGGVRGSVVITQSLPKKIERLDSNRIQVNAGVACGQVARYCAREGLAGLEFFAGIPGTVGGALRMNAGAYGGETWDCVELVEVITRGGERKIRLPAEYQIGYRTAVSPEEEGFLSATFCLKPVQPSIAQEYIRTMLARRNATQPTHLPNGGSVFRNPPNDYAARLIEACGLKGYRIGGVSVSTKHANFIVNDQRGTAADIENLIEWVAAEVARQQGVDLIREVYIVGEKG